MPVAAPCRNGAAPPGLLGQPTMKKTNRKRLNAGPRRDRTRWPGPAARTTPPRDNEPPKSDARGAHPGRTQPAKSLRPPVDLRAPMSSTPQPFRLPQPRSRPSRFAFQGLACHRLTHAPPPLQRAPSTAPPSLVRLCATRDRSPSGSQGRAARRSRAPPSIAVVAGRRRHGAAKQTFNKVPPTPMVGGALRGARTAGTRHVRAAIPGLRLRRQIGRAHV